MGKSMRFAWLLLAFHSVALAAPSTGRKHNLPSGVGEPGHHGENVFDYVVVGGGTAGLLIAARLSEDPKISVAVVEAGSYYQEAGNTTELPIFDAMWTGKDPSDTSPLVDWGFVTVPQAGALDASIHYARGKCLGGSSGRNYMVYMRTTRDAHDKWAEMVGDESYTYDQLLPYFEKSLNFTPPGPLRPANATPEYDLSSLGTGGGPLSVTYSNWAMAVTSYIQRGMQALGIQPIPGFTSGKLIGSAYFLSAIQTPIQKRESSQTAFLTPAEGRPNLKVYRETLGKKIVFDSKKRAKGVLISTGEEEQVLAAKREVIVSAGVFQSPQLLMVSGVGPAATLAKHNIPVVADRSGVGQNLQDHVFMGLSYRVNAITGSSLAVPEFKAEAEATFNQGGSSILGNTGGEFAGWEKLPPHLRSGLSDATLEALASFPPDWPEVEYISLGGFLGKMEIMDGGPVDGYNYHTVAWALQAAMSRGTVDISSADMADPPIIDPRWLTHSADEEVVVAGFKRVRELFATEAMAEILIGSEYFPGLNVSTDADILNVIRQSMSPVYHASATCAMGRRDDPNAVVDSSARVIGVKGLRVVDASALPFVPPGHPMAVIYGFAEKIAADILKGK